MKKRIILTVTNDLTYDRRMQRICRSLACGGYEVELVGRKLSYSAAITEEPYKQTRLNCLFTKGKLFYIEYNMRLFLYLLFKKFDAVCAVDLDTIAPAFVVAKLKGAKRVYDAHEYFPEVPEVSRRPAVKKVWEWVERTFVPKADMVYAVSSSIAEVFNQKYSSNAATIMNAPLRDEVKVVKTDSARFIVYQGALNEGRGLEQLIEAVRGLDIQLKIIGEGDISNTLRAMVKNWQLSDKVQFLGFVKPADLKAITVNAWLGFGVSENKGLSYYYSLNNKFFDYVHAGIPQLCNAFPEYLRLNKVYGVAVLVESCTVEAIKAAIARLMTDRESYLQLQKNCEVCSRELNWQQEEKKLLMLYEQLFR